VSDSNSITRQIVVIVSAVIAVVGSVIGSGFAGGTPIQDAAGGALSATATPIAPAGGAFSIWSIIYLGLVAYAIWQALPAHRSDPRQRRLGYWVAASLVLNAAWILSIQFDALALSLPIIVILLVVLIRTFLICVGTRPANWREAVVVDGTVGLYLGWVCVATAANAAALLRASGFRGGPIDGSTWAIAIIAVAGIVGILLAIRGRGRISPALSLGWGLAWIGVGRLTGAPLLPAVGIIAVIAAVVVLVFTVAVRLRTRGAEPSPSPVSSRI
jgi:hypothetical protein